MAKARKVNVVQGVGQFVGPNHMEITAADGSKKTGVLEGVTDEGLNLLEQVKEGKKITTVPVHIPFDEVVKAQIVISFK